LWSLSEGVDPEDITSFKTYMTTLASHYGVKVKGNKVRGITLKQVEA
jgi:hypothetical protein